MSTTKSESESITIDANGNVVVNGGKITIKKNGDVVVTVKDAEKKNESTNQAGRQILHG